MVAILISIQNVVKGKGVQLKNTLSSIDIMHILSTEHPNSPKALPIKDKLSWVKDKVEIKLVIQALEKLEKDAMKTMNAYHQHHIVMERLIKSHKLVPIKAWGEVRPEKNIEHEVQVMIHAR